MVKSHSWWHIRGTEDHNRMAIVPWVSKYLLSYFIAAPKTDVKGMQEIMMRKYGLHTPKHTCLTVMKIIGGATDGKHEKGTSTWHIMQRSPKPKN